MLAHNVNKRGYFRTFETFARALFSDKDLYVGEVVSRPGLRGDLSVHLSRLSDLSASPIVELGIFFVHLPVCH